MAFYAIYVPPELGEGDLRAAADFWPAATTAGRTQHEMLTAAGFVEIEESDVTETYRATAAAWLRGRRRGYARLVEALGETALNQKIAEGEETLRKLDGGMLRRSLLAARRPDPAPRS